MYGDTFGCAQAWARYGEVVAVTELVGSLQ